MVGNVHITFFWGWAKSRLACQCFSHELISLLAPTLLAQGSAGINPITAANQGPHQGSSFPVAYGGPGFHQMSSKLLLFQKAFLGGGFEM